MEVRKLRGNASVIPSGGSTKTYKQRESGIFFASEGYYQDFDNWDNISTSNSNISYNSFSNGNAYISKNIDLSSFFAFCKASFDSYSTSTKANDIFGVDVGGKLISLARSSDNTLDLRVSDNFVLNTSFKTTSDQTIETKDIPSIISSTTYLLEFAVDVPNKSITMYLDGKEIKFSFAGIELDSDKVSRVVWFVPPGNIRYLKEIALSYSRVGNIHIQTLTPGAVGDYTDFSSKSYGSIFNSYYSASISTFAESSTAGAKQLYKLSAPSFKTNEIIDCIFTRVHLSGDEVTAATDLFKVGENEFEGEAVVPSAASMKRIWRQYVDNPATGEAWTAADLSALQLGCKVLGEEV
ncbi:MAG: hypothetical protein ACI3ZR_08920 [bacterium]